MVVVVLFLSTEMQVAVDGCAADAKDFADIGGFESLGFEFITTFYILMVRGDFPSASGPSLRSWNRLSSALGKSFCSY